MKFLIADDDARFREVLKHLVAPWASSVCEASDGEEAIAHYEEYQPDWVLMDVRMKPTNGLAATREIKSRFPQARIVIVTQYDEPSLRAEAQEAGACSYVLKEDLPLLQQTLQTVEEP
jgi:CheY-like chemotaxis protein